MMGWSKRTWLPSDWRRSTAVGWLHLTLRQARKLVILVVGSTVLVFGLILTVTPGPAFVVIPIGLAILATEFVWARQLLNRIKHEATGLAERFNGRSTKAEQPGNQRSE